MMPENHQTGKSRQLENIKNFLVDTQQDEAFLDGFQFLVLDQHDSQSQEGCFASFPRKQLNSCCAAVIFAYLQ
ncbi:MAG TPA: hypothetical protein PLE92_00910 [Lentisphaeria bacterium]|nr:hypothetical protein [Lentisphaeria bacterium]HQL86866.1 hypothetical protein [Lentisphaeria bacterium]